MITYPAYSAEWFMLHSDGYIDTSSINAYESRYASYWIKLMKSGEDKTSEGKPIHHILINIISDCKTKNSASKSWVKYDSRGNSIDSFDAPNYTYISLYNFTPIVPDSVGETWHNFACNYVGIK